MDHGSAPVANMVAGGAFVTDGVQKWMNNNPGQAAEAFTRDQAMQAFARLDHYKQYEQGSLSAIMKRMTKSVGVPATKSPAQ